MYSSESEAIWHQPSTTGNCVRFSFGGDGFVHLTNSHRPAVVLHMPLEEWVIKVWQARVDRQLPMCWFLPPHRFAPLGYTPAEWAVFAQAVLSGDRRITAF